MRIKTIGVYCGASKGRSNQYAHDAHDLAHCFIEHDITLVYGGAKVGLMGILADQMIKYGGKVIGVIPEFLKHQEVAHTQLTELHIVNSMHERKNLINKLSDAFILLPGGIGSLDEFFEILTLAQLGQHNKPRGILNTNNYYGNLLKFLDHAVDESFWNTANQDRIFVENNPKILLHLLLNYNAPVLNRWIDKEIIKA